MDAVELYHAGRAAWHNWVGARIAAELHPAVPVAPRPVVLSSIELDPDAPGLPAGARAVARVGLATGWAVRARYAIAIDPHKGRVETAALVCSRHEERCWAAWWGGGFECGWYGLERLGWARLKDGYSAAPVPIATLSVVAMKATAAGLGIKVPSTLRKDGVVDYLAKMGVTSVPRPKPVRGVLDALEGIQISSMQVDVKIGM